jgi:hypothetical protein
LLKDIASMPHMVAMDFTIAPLCPALAQCHPKKLS